MINHIPPLEATITYTLTCGRANCDAVYQETHEWFAGCYPPLFVTPAGWTIAGWSAICPKHELRIVDKEQEEEGEVSKSGN